jgi:metallo-beta-lactamase family protein
VRKADDSKKINDLKKPCVIISASGMITAGRIVHHINNTIENPRNTILIVRYCAEGTIGAQLSKGAEKIRVFGEEKKVKAQIRRMHSFSAHGDQTEMVEFLDNQSREKLKEIFLVHGVIARQEVMAKELTEAGFKKISIPKLGDVVELK